jgi:DNA-binding protein HU-beta
MPASKATSKSPVPKKPTQAKAAEPVAAKPKAVAVPTITLKQIGSDLAAAHELPKQTVETLFNDLVGTIVKQIKKGSKVRISGLGILQAKKRASRIGRNPATGEELKIKARKTVTFKIARDLKEGL